MTESIEVKSMDSIDHLTYSTEKLPPKTVVVFFIKDVCQFFEKI